MNKEMSIIVEQVKQVHAALCEKQSYSKWLAAEDDEHAIEGAVYFDLFMATKMIQEQAAKMGLRELAQTELGPIADVMIELGIINQKQAAALEVAEAEAQRERFDLHGIKLN